MLYEFYILGTLAPDVRSQYTKKPYLRFDKAPETFFLSALRALLTRRGREPSVSIRKKYPLEPRVYFRCYWGIKIKDDRFCYFWKPYLLVTDCTVREIYSERFFFFHFTSSGKFAWTTFFAGDWEVICSVEFSNLVKTIHFTIYILIIILSLESYVTNFHTQRVVVYIWEK